MKKGAKPRWFKILENHQWNNNDVFADNSHTLKRLPISHKSNKKDWIFDTKSEDITFGKVAKKSASNMQVRVIFYAHWIQHDTNDHYSLTPCQGCKSQCAVTI